MEVVDQLFSTKAQVLGHFRLPDELLDRAYAPGKWSVRFLLHHIADAETVFYDRLRRILSEPRQVLWAFNQDAWAAGLDYGSIPLEQSERIFSSVRDGIICLARLHYADKGHLEFVHSGTGVRTFKDEVDKVVWHTERHLEQISRALSQ